MLRRVSRHGITMKVTLTLWMNQAPSNTDTPPLFKDKQQKFGRHLHSTVWNILYFLEIAEIWEEGLNLPRPNIDILPMSSVHCLYTEKKFNKSRNKKMLWKHIYSIYLYRNSVFLFSLLNMIYFYMFLFILLIAYLISDTLRF